MNKDQVDGRINDAIGNSTEVAGNVVGAKALNKKVKTRALLAKNSSLMAKLKTG